MGIPGSYLTVAVNGSVIAETTDVNIKVEAKALKSTSMDSGLNAEHIAGSVKLALAGRYLFASNGDNWNALFNFMKEGDEVQVAFYRNAVNFLSGWGVIRKLNPAGGNSDSLVTGMYGIRYNFTEQDPDVPTGILTETGFAIKAETGETLLIE